MYIETASLPTVLQSALTALGYHKKDIRVQVSEKIVLGSDAYGDGYQAFTTLVNLSTGQSETARGSWGGQNMFDHTNAVDNDDREYTLPSDGVAIKGQRGGGRPVMATIHIPASMKNRMLPGPEIELTTEDRDALYCHQGIRGGQYRKDELRRRQVTPNAINALIERGFLKRNSAGAVSITTAGKNALGDYRGY